MKNDITRRDFIKGTMAAGVTIAGAGFVTSCATSPYNAKGLPTTILGKTGVQVPRIAIGLGSRFCTIDDEDEALTMLNYALDNGLYYWDTAYIYENAQNGVVSEERLGKVLKHRRKEVFISTKVTSRDPDEAMRQIEGSLKRLQVDHLDMLKIHDIVGGDKLTELQGKGRLIEIVQKMKEEGVTRFIGFSGHSEGTALRYMAENYDFDSMLMAMNHWRSFQGFDRRKEAIPVAYDKGMGIMLMKAVRPIENDKTLDPKQLIRYALSIKEVNGLVLGMDSKKVVDSNLELLKNFTAMPQEDMDQLTARLKPYYQHKNIPWMKRGYCDGNWV